MSRKSRRTSACGKRRAAPDAAYYRIFDAALASSDSLSVTPDKDPAVDNTQRGCQRFTTTAVIDEVEQAVRLAAAVVDAGVRGEY